MFEYLIFKYTYRASFIIFIYYKQQMHNNNNNNNNTLPERCFYTQLARAT
jgi:hypothetical protein